MLTSALPAALLRQSLRQISKFISPRSKLILPCITACLISWVGPSALASPAGAQETKVCLDLPDLNVFVSHNLKHSGSIEGRVIVGQDAILTRSYIGVGLPPDAMRVDLAVGSNLNYEYGAVPHGHATYGHQSNISRANFYGGLYRSVDIDFAGLNRDISGRSQYWSQLSPNAGFNSFTRGEHKLLYLTGHNPELNIANLSDVYLQGVNKIHLSAPPTATVLINIFGPNINLSEITIILEHISANKVLINLPNAQKISLGKSQLAGTLVAPFAHVTQNYSKLRGTLFATSLSGIGHFLLAPFSNCWP